MASLQRCLFDDSSGDDLLKNDELLEEKSEPKSRKLSNKDNIPFEIDTPSTSAVGMSLPVDLCSGIAQGNKNTVPTSVTVDSQNGA